MISILLNTRKTGYENNGGILSFMKSLSDSLNDKSLIEVILKMDSDDFDGISEYVTLGSQHNYFDIKTKCIINERYYYKGLHLGYFDCFKIIDHNSKVIVCMSDDFDFVRKGWEIDTLQLIAHLTKNDLFTIQDFIGYNINTVPIAPMWSRKIIELCNGFGPTYATDAWSVAVNEYIGKIFPQNVITMPIYVSRRGCKLDDDANIRWHTDRAEMQKFINSPQYKLIIDDMIKTINQYLTI